MLTFVVLAHMLDGMELGLLWVRWVVVETFGTMFTSGTGGKQQ